MQRQSLIATREVAQLLHVDPATVTRMVHRGALEAAEKAPGIRGSFLFDRAEVEALAQERVK